LSGNPNAMDLLEQRKRKIHWQSLSGNPNAIPLLKQKQDKIEWVMFSGNPNIFEPSYDYVLK
jgi:hypothetical protein